jgi:hypothetical protein
LFSTIKKINKEIEINFINI